MSIDTDFHSHVSRSSAREMAQSAQEKGLRVLGLSEHDFQMEEARSTLEHLSPEGPLLTFPTYIEEVRTAHQDLRLEVRLGMEVDFIPGKNEVIQAFLQSYSWDFLIGSVHEVDGLLFESDNKWGREVSEALWLRYFELLRAAVNSRYFSLVSHPVRMRMQNPFLPPTFDEELERLAAEATSCDVALEANGYDVLSYPGLVRRLVKACVLHQTPVSVGSDAHFPKNVAQAHEQTEVILREAGISKVRIWRRRVVEEYKV